MTYTEQHSGEDRPRLPVERGIPDQVVRMVRTLALITLMALLLSLGTLSLQVVSQYRAIRRGQTIQAISATQRRAACIAGIQADSLAYQADFDAYAADALAAPPAPDPGRLVATKGLAIAAENLHSISDKLKHLDKYCPLKGTP